MAKLKIKKGDVVEVIAGDDKGTQGEVLQVLRDKDKLVVDGVNIHKKHLKPTQENQGGIVDKALPVHISNVKLVDPKSKELTRVGRKIEDGKIVRYSKKSGEILN